MTTPIWQSGHLYLPGDLVQPVQAAPAESAEITNAGFETGDATGWTLGTGVTVGAGGNYAGSYGLTFTGTGGVTDVIHDRVAVAPGTAITASCMYAQGSASSGQNAGRVFLRWYTAALAVISTSYGTSITSSSGGGWKQSPVTATAPANAAHVAIGIEVNRTNAAASYADAFAWDYVTVTTPAGLIYKAVQTGPGTSGNIEPAWPQTTGLTVVDNTVTWEAVLASRVTWQASPILQSGATEPTWPTTPGQFVSDGTVSWECISRRVEDTNCPNTTAVIIIGSKVYAVDGDITRFSATANPLDWTTENDAGFMPTGLQSANANDMAVLAQYRSNLIAMNASSFQNWQVDPDPANMALLDQMEGIGSTWQQAAQAVGNELLYLAAQGVRSVGIAAGAENLAAGDVGEPIDELVQEAVRVAVANGSKVLSTYYPSAGQYWLTFSDYPPPALAISGDVPDGNVGDAVSGTYTVSGGVLPYGSVTVTAGTFPAGLTLNSDGTYSGSPTLAGSYSWTVSVTDADGSTASVADSATVGVYTTLISGAVTGTQYIVASADGLDWDSAPIASGGDANYAPYMTGLPGRYFGRGVAAVIPAAYSTDSGVTWTATAANVISGSFGDAYTGGALFIPWYLANSFKSTDYGVTFTDTGKKHSRYVALNDAGSLAAIDSAAGIVESTDTGSTWSAGVSLSGVLSFSSGGCQGSDGTAYYYGGSLSSVPKLVRCIGSALTTVTLPTMTGATVLLSFAYAAGITTKIVGSDNGLIAYDNGDGSGFRLATTQLPDRVHQIFWNGARFIAICDPAASSTNTIYTSPTGDVWTLATITTARKWYSIAQERG